MRGSIIVWRKMIKLDLRFMMLPLIISVTVAAAFITALAISPDIFTPSVQSDGVYKTSAFFFIDFLLPFLLSACIIMQLGGTLEKNTFDFLSSMPVKLSPLLRWAFSMLIILVIHLSSIVFAFLTLKEFTSFHMSFYEMCFISFSNLILFCSLGLILMLIFRRVFYVYSILYGYLLVDLIVGDNFLGNKSVFVNIFAQCTKDEIQINRIILYIISAVCVVVSFVLIKCNFLRRINKCL